MAKRVGNGLDLTGTRIINLGDPQAPGDSVNLQYLMNFINGLRFKLPARAATTGNISLASPGASIDGVALNNGDRVLVKNQTNGSENGVYIWTGATSPLTRATDADSTGELQSAVVVVSEGTATDAATGALANADRAWLQRVDSVVVGTTVQQWIPLPGASTMYQNGNGLALNGVTFSVQPVPGGGISVVAGGVQVDATVVSRHTEKPLGDGTSTTLTIPHNLGRRPLPVTMMNVATGALEETDVVFTDDNNVALTFAVAPGTNAYRVSIG
jgi:hypothetical protein